MWYVRAKTGLSKEELNEKLKSFIRDSAFFHKMFDDYGISMDRIDNDLHFHLEPLDGMHARSKGKDVFLDDELFKDGDFFEDKIHFVVHEMSHWLTRLRENDCYFADPEEIEAFTLGMAYELLKGRGEREVAKLFFPIISKHLKISENADVLFGSLLTKAKIRVKRFGI